MMINKFQLGGDIQQKLALDLVSNGIPQETVLELSKNKELWGQLVLIYLQEGIQGVANALQQLTKAARHGTKLQYIKSLKNQCAEDEELYYYKKGGSVKCGCKKKEEGGLVEKAQTGWKTIFKKRKENTSNNNTSSTKKPDNTIYVSRKKAEEAEKYRKEEEEKKKKTYVPDKSEEGAPPKGINKGLGKNKCGGKVKKDSNGSKVVKEFKAKCGAKMKKHQLGGSLNGIPFMQAGTPKGGIEKSDNTRVQRIPNNGEGVYEQIPVNGWNFVPIVGTLKEAKMLDQGDPNASVTRLGISLAGDLAGAGMIGTVAKAARRVNGIQKALRARGYLQFTKDGSLWFRLPKKIIRGYGDKLHTYEIPNIYGGSSFKTIPTVDYTPAATAPLVLTLRVPAEAPFFNYNK